MITRDEAINKSLKYLIRDRRQGIQQSPPSDRQDPRLSRSFEGSQDFG